MTRWSEADLETWRWVAGPEGAELVAAAVECTPGDVTAIARLRKRWSPEQVRIALELAEARRKAVTKFGQETAQRIVADVGGVEQASSALTAEWKARRFAELPGDPRVWDLCAGIGGDAMGLAAVTGPERLTVVDLDPVRAWMAGTNASAASLMGDVAELAADDGMHVDFFHLDPARRLEGTGGSRRWELEDYEPGPSVMARLAARAQGGAIKLGPGLNVAALREAMGEAGATAEVEFISEHGRLVQAVLWTGELVADDAAGKVRATMLPGGESVVGDPEGAWNLHDDAAALSPGDVDAARVGRWMYQADPALERAGLLHWAMGAFELREVHPDLGLLTGDHGVDTPWLTAFEVLDVIPGWRIKKIRSALASLAGDDGWAVVDVKTRGSAVEDVDAAARALRGEADPANTPTLTVFGLRLGDRKVAVVTRRR